MNENEGMRDIPKVASMSGKGMESLREVMRTTVEFTLPRRSVKRTMRRAAKLTINSLRLTTAHDDHHHPQPPLGSSEVGIQSKSLSPSLVIYKYVLCPFASTLYLLGF